MIYTDPKRKSESNQNIFIPKNNSTSFAKIIEFSSPIFICSLSKTMYGQLTELSILFLIFFSLQADTNTHIEPFKLGKYAEPHIF